MREALRKERLERFIGVVYGLETELYFHYAEAELPAQFGAFVWFDTARAVDALFTTRETQETPDTFPFGV